MFQRSPTHPLVVGTIVALLGCASVSALLGFQKAEPRLIEITARRYTFEPATVEVRQGERVRLVVRSADGLHGFAIKKFNVDKEVLKGQDVKVDIVAKDAGEFPIMCSVICGEGHATMTGTLKVVAQE
jgi:cytochrome c oxidase subunit 2